MVVLYKENTAVLLHFVLMMMMSLCDASQTSDFLGDISDLASLSSNVSSS